MELLKIKDLHAKAGEKDILKGLDLTINKGERIAQGAFFNFLVADNGNTDTVRSGGFGSTNAN